MNTEIITPLLCQVLTGRGITTDEQIADFLHYPQVDELEVLTELPNVQRAATELIEAIKAGKHITILGDYDCDGVCAITVMQRGIKGLANSLGMPAKVDYLIPNRFEDGYGLTPSIIAKLRERKPQLIITVDNGSSAAVEIAELLDLGFELIVTDHHELGEGEIVGVAHVNPKVCDLAPADNPLYNICGATVALGLIITSSKLLETQYSAKAIQWPVLINYAAMATIADVMPLVGINRSLVKLGLEQVNTGQNLAVSEMLRLSDEKRNRSKDSIIYSALDLSFNVIPAINSAGRIGSSDIAANLLLEADAGRRAELAAELFEINEKRKLLGDNVVAEAQAQCLAQLEQNPDEPALFCLGENWHEGVLGIVAGRLAREFNLSTFVFTKGKHGGEDVLKGSARAADGVDLHGAIAGQLDLLIRFGGHKAAAGITLEQANYDVFTERVSAAIGQQIALFSEEIDDASSADLALTLSELSLRDVKSLALLEPTGAGNPRSVFTSQRVAVSDWRVVGAGQNHLSLSVYDHSISERDSIKSIWFGQNALPLSESSTYTISYRPTINEFRGVVSVNLQIQDMQ